MGRVQTAMVTPFTKDLELDFEGVAPLVDYLCKSGTEGLVVSGTTGESPALSLEEKEKLWTEVIKTKPQDVPVIAGTGTNNTRETIEASLRAQKAGADALMIVTPYYNRPPQEEMRFHFEEVAKRVDLPIMLYNVPKRTGANLLPQTVENLMNCDNIIAIKEASGDLGQVAKLRQLLGNRIKIFSGEDNITLPMMSVGASGVVSVAAHIVGTEFKDMLEGFVAGHVDKAMNKHYKLMPLFDALSISTNPIPIKCALNLAGVFVGPLRAPLRELKEENAEKLKRVLEEYEII